MLIHQSCTQPEVFSRAKGTSYHAAVASQHTRRSRGRFLGFVPHATVAGVRRFVSSTFFTGPRQTKACDIDCRAVTARAQLLCSST